MGPPAQEEGTTSREGLVAPSSRVGRLNIGKYRGKFNMLVLDILALGRAAPPLYWVRVIASGGLSLDIRAPLSMGGPF